jgi:putative FmdB family regulatory protein
MPNYKYECKDCGHVLVEFQSMTDDPLLQCPECGKSALRRLIGSGMAPIFKGKGFYTTDYKASPTPACESAKSDSAECKCCPQKESK